jgi:hypothetical protein
MSSPEQRTSGSSVREAHPVSGEYLRYVLDVENRELECEVTRTSAGRTAKTLAKTDTLRVTLVATRRRMKERLATVEGGGGQ